MKHRQMSLNNLQAGEDAPNAPERNDSLLDAPPQRVGEINTGHSASFLPAAFRNSTPEWQCARLEPQVRQLLESLPDPVIAHDSGVIIGFNQRVTELLRCPAETILWRRLSKFIEPVSLPTLTRWIEAPDDYSILVNGVSAGGNCLLLRLEAIASLLCPGGRRVEVVALVEFAPVAHADQSLESDKAPWIAPP
jgi:PAS domain-containing protein